MINKRKSTHADSKHAKDHSKKLVETGSDYLHLEKEHKDWYLRGVMGKQRGKPKYAPPQEKKSKKIWKNK